MSIKMFFISLIAFAAMGGGLYATWHLASAPAKNDDTSVGIGLEIFNYAPEEVLPDSPESDELGENHLDLIQKILYEVSYGLNATKKPIIHNLLNKTGDVVHSTQNVQGGNLKHLMLDKTNAENLLFQIEYVSDSEYITYSYRAADAQRNPIGTEIEVYKTLMIRGDDNKWSAPYSYRGTANTTHDNDGNLSAIFSGSWKFTK